MEKTSTRRDAIAWRQIVDEQLRSGLSVVAFCEREGVSVASFYGWRSKLRRSGDTDSGSVTVTAKPSATQMGTSGFIDLGALGISGPRIEVRLELGGGVALQLVRG